MIMAVRAVWDIYRELKRETKERHRDAYKELAKLADKDKARKCYEKIGRLTDGFTE